MTTAAPTRRDGDLSLTEVPADPTRPLTWIALAAAAAAGSYLLARMIGLGPAPGPFAYWPIYGIMVGILFRRPTREWPGIVAASAATQVLTIYLVRGDLAGGATPLGAIIGALQAALSVAIVRWRARDPFLLDTPRGLAWFVVVAVMLVPLAISPVLALAYASGLHQPYGATWGPLFAGNTLSVLLFAPPFLFRRSTGGGAEAWPAHVAEVLLCQSAIAGLALVIFGGPDYWLRFVALPYTLFPLLAWSALRCGPRWTALGIVGVATIAAWFTARGAGPFAALVRLDVNHRVLGLQAYLAFVAFTGLVLVALTEERMYSFAEVSLRDSIRRAFFDSSVNGMTLAGLDGRYVLANRAATEVYGGELTGRHPRELLPADEAAEIETHDRRVRERGEALGFEETLTAGGARRRLTVMRFPVRDHTGTLRYVGMIARDDTAGRELATRLEGAQRVEILGRLAAGVAHDLNNLLMVVVGYTRLLQEEPGRTQDETEMLVEMGTAGSEAAKLTDRLMALGRGRRGPGGTVAIDDTLRELQRLLRVLVRGDVDLETRLGAAGLRVAADPTAIEQIVLNLVSNARDAIQGEGRITITTDASWRDGHPRVRLSVADTGVGMDPATLERVFEPFYTTKESRGTGIGLYTVAAIVGQAGGEIHVTSVPGAGTTFVVDLPAVEAPDDA